MFHQNKARYLLEARKRFEADASTPVYSLTSQSSDQVLSVLMILTLISPPFLNMPNMQCYWETILRGSEFDSSPQIDIATEFDNLPAFSNTINDKNSKLISHIHLLFDYLAFPLPSHSDMKLIMPQWYVLMVISLSC